MMILDDILALKAAGKILPALIGAGLVFGTGFAAAEIYEHKVPWGLGPKLERLRDSIPAKLKEERRVAFIDGLEAQQRVDGPAFDEWGRQLRLCRADLSNLRDGSARAISKAEVNQSASTAAAYRLGRATCGANDAPLPPPASPDGAPPIVRLRLSGEDLGALVNAGAATAPALRP